MDIPVNRLKELCVSVIWDIENYALALNLFLRDGNVLLSSVQINLAEIPVHSQTLSTLKIIKLVKGKFSQKPS